MLVPTLIRVSTGASTGAIFSNPSEHPPLSTIIVLPRASRAQRWNCVRPASCSARCNNVIRVSPTPSRTIAPSYFARARSGACTAAPCCPPTRSVASGPSALNEARGWSPRCRSGRASTRARNRAHVAIDGVRSRREHAVVRRRRDVHRVVPAILRRAQAAARGSSRNPTSGWERAACIRRRGTRREPCRRRRRPCRTTATTSGRRPHAREARARRLRRRDRHGSLPLPHHAVAGTVTPVAGAA